MAARLRPGRDQGEFDLRQVIAPALVSAVEHYLAEVRPLMPGARAHDGLWPGSKGRPMAEVTIYQAVMKRSRALFGVAINPHSFRSIAATFLAEHSPEAVLHAPGLLGHHDRNTTSKHYIRARKRRASRNVANVLRRIRDA